MIYTDLESILDYTVENDMWLKVLNGRVPYTELIDKSSFLSYLEEENERYCLENGLCVTCRSLLQEREQIEEYCGSRMVVGRYLQCPNNC